MPPSYWKSIEVVQVGLLRDLRGMRDLRMRCEREDRVSWGIRGNMSPV